jgi:uncharacterized protein
VPHDDRRLLGLVLEQLLARTSLRVIVLDPDPDFVKLARVRPDADVEEAESYRAAVEGLRVLGSGERVDRPLRLRSSTHLLSTCRGPHR